MLQQDLDYSTVVDQYPLSGYPGPRSFAFGDIVVVLFIAVQAIL